MHHEVTVAIAAPGDTVWAILSDVERWPSWTASVRTIRLEGPFAVRTIARIRQPKLPAMTWTITELDPGRSFTWRSDAPGSRTVAAHHIAPTGDGTSEVTLTLDQTGALGSLVGLLLRGLTKRYMQMEADGLAAEATSRA